MYKLLRISDTSDGTFGVLMDEDGFPLCVTLEDSWMDNRTSLSCIPTGTYDVHKYSGTRYKDVWKIEAVEGRSAILIHAGNTEDDTRGCVLVGKQYGLIHGKHAIMHSRSAMTYLRTVLPDSFILKIED